MEWISVKESLPPIDREIVLYASKIGRTTIAIFATEKNAKSFLEHFRFDYWIYTPKKEENENE